MDGVDLDILDGEFFCLLGPSGSGKTTLLRMIAGFELPTDGTILLQGTDVTRLPPFDRDVNTVFQDYVLFPHMSVADNVGYGLKVKKVPKAERVRRVGEALDTVQLGAYGARKPSQLSGGQRQRIALARALINRPKVLLLDVAGAAAAGGDGKGELNLTAWAGFTQKAWVDPFTAAAKAKHPNCMYLWMDHMISPVANAAATAPRISADVSSAR